MTQSFQTRLAQRVFLHCPILGNSFGVEDCPSLHLDELAPVPDLWIAGISVPSVGFASLLSKGNVGTIRSSRVVLLLLLQLSVLRFCYFLLRANIALLLLCVALQYLSTILM